MKLLKNIAYAAFLPTYFTYVAICDVGTKRVIPDEEYWTGEIVVIIALVTFSMAVAAFCAGRGSK